MKFWFFFSASNKDARKRLQEIPSPINKAASESSTDQSSRKNIKRKVLENLEGNTQHDDFFGY